MELNKIAERSVDSLCKRYNVSKDLIDYRAIWDSSLTLAENKNILIERLKNLSNKNDEIISEQNIEQFKVIEQEIEVKEREILNKEFDKAIEEIKKNKSVELDKYFRTPIELIKITASGSNNALILISDGGLGKSYTTLTTLKELDLKVEEDYVYLTTYLTPLELYHKLYENRLRTIVIDDVEKLFEDSISVSILKNATFSTVNKRIVSYHSTSEKLKCPEEFEFKGKIIMLCNKIPRRNSELVESLLSRCLVYHIEFSYEDKIKIFYELAKSLKIDSRIVDFIKENSSRANDTLNFRTLLQANLIYEYYQKNPSEFNGHSWELILRELLFKSVNPKIKLILELINSNKIVSEQIKEFVDMGYSRATYFRYKKMLN